MKVIKLTKENDTWYADFIGDADILNAFGTTKIPTAFTEHAGVIEVSDAVRKLNPSHLVVIGN